MTELTAIPYVPGHGRGALVREVGGQDRGRVLALGQHELAALIESIAAGMPPPAALIVIEAAPLSHAMLRLLALGIPAVTITAPQAEMLTAGEILSVDGAGGRISSRPLSPQPPPMPVAGATPRTADGTPVTLAASVGSAAGAALARTNGAAAVGLVRSEYLLPRDRRPPDGAFFAETLETLCAAAAPLPVTVRLLDIAADKRPAWLGELPGLAGALGLQGVRLYDREPVRAAVDAELEALGRLAPRYPLSVLIPYMVSRDELTSLRPRMEARLPAQVPVGAMAETPAAVLDIAAWLDALDFVTIGCNDLMQCLFAADRDLPALRGLLDPYAPVLYRLLAQTAGAAGPRLERVSLCGLLPQLPGTLPVLLGLGYRRFSVEPLLVPYLAARLAAVDIARARPLAERVCDARDSGEVRKLLGVD